MLAEQAEVMLQLGMDTEGAQLRAKMQSAALLSGVFEFIELDYGSSKLLLVDRHLKAQHSLFPCFQYRQCTGAPTGGCKSKMQGRQILIKYTFLCSK